MGNFTLNLNSLRHLAVAVIVLVGGSLQIHVSGQTASGRIVGTITDPSGSVVPGVKVTVLSTETKVTRDTITNQDGYFQVIDLPIGNYHVEVEAPGFRKLQSETKPLQINQSLRYDMTLEVGQTSETVQVEANAGGVETVNVTLGQSITSRPIVDMPLNGRNTLDLLKLQPGVTETNPDSTAAGTFSIAGSRTDSVTYLLDGGLNNSLLDNGVVYNPNPDSVAEFRLLTSNYTAEYGRNAGGIVSEVMKSGSNQLHGSAFEYLRNNAMDANPFFVNARGLPIPVLKRNQFGGTIGGPITIPKVINGKDKLFFFAAYQGQRQSQTVFTDQSTAFTPAELNGDFSQSNATRNGPDPDVVNFLQANPWFQSNPDLAARGIIDPTRINSVAANYIKSGLIPTSSTGVILPSAGSTYTTDELTGKIDYNITSKHHLSATLGGGRSPRTRPYVNGTNVNGYPDSDNNHTYFANVSLTSVFTPALVNEFRATANRYNRLSAIPALDLPKAADLGIGITPDNPSGPTMLGFNSGMQIGFSPNGPTNLVNNTYAYSDTVTWTKGRHTVKGGFFFSAYQNNTVYDYYVNGEFFFYGEGGVGSGNDRADFLFGAADEYLQFGEAPSNIRSKNYAGFVQDEWRIHPHLTLTFGVRYDYDTPKLDLQGRSFSIIPGQQSQRFPNAPVGLNFPGDPNAPVGANFPDKNDWAPEVRFRLGRLRQRQD